MNTTYRQVGCRAKRGQTRGLRALLSRCWAGSMSHVGGEMQNQAPLPHASIPFFKVLWVGNTASPSRTLQS